MLVLIGLATLFIFSRKNSVEHFTGNPVQKLNAPVIPIVMRNDSQGAGHFGAKRKDKNGKPRKHKGIDLVVSLDQPIFSPIDGIIIRRANPYSDDPNFTGLFIQGIGRHQQFTTKIFYMNPIRISQSVTAGQLIGYAQDISKKYSPLMIDHIHLEIYKNNHLVDPTPYFF